MKVVVAWLCLVALALLAAGSCSIKHASEQYDCDTNADCAPLGDNRVCSEGTCVVPGGQIDAAIDGKLPIDAPIDAMLVCPPQCTSCNLEKKECVIDCNQNPTACGAQITCPLGWACNVKCNTPSSCRMGVSCVSATSCKVECSGNFSCRNVACGAGACSVGCTGGSSCSGIACNQSCACDVSCGNGASCFNVTCTKPQCDTGLGCSSQPASCNTCP
jgi:hypothetical protein